MDIALSPPNQPAGTLAQEVRRAVIWRSGSQLVAQGVQWAVTFAVIRILSPHDYGLFAMTQVVLVFLNMLNGYGLASGLVQAGELTPRAIRQAFGMLLVVNAALAAAQLTLAPLAALYYRQPLVADLLRVQALLYLATPFIALPQAVLSRAMDFRHQARANLAASVAGAGAALAGALAGLGVWTLVWAPIAVYLGLSGHWGKAALLALWGGVIVSTIDNILYPLLVGSRLRSHPVAILLSIIGGVALFGIPGIILGPVTFTVATTLLEIWRARTLLSVEDVQQ